MSTLPQVEATVEEVSPETLEKYVGILVSNGITDKVEKVVVKDAGLRGEGFVSQSKYVTVTFQNGEKSPLNLFVKGLTGNDSHTGMVKMLKAFEKEARFFMEYVPAARKLCEAKGQPHLLDIYPKCFHADEEIVVLENLVLDKGFVLLDKEEMQDLDSARVALSTLAKHHAVSLAMIQDVGGAEAFFKEFPNLDYDPFSKAEVRPIFEPMFTNGLNTNITMLEKNPVEGSKEILEKLHRFHGKVYDSVMDMLSEPIDDEPVLVLNHGDYWNNNMMFKKDNTGAIIDHKAIDLQITKYNSPMADVGYYMFSSVKAEVRRRHTPELIQWYLTELKRVNKNLGLSEINANYDDMWRSYKKKFKLGFWFGACAASGPGFAVSKEFDISELGDVSEWGNYFDKLLQKWIEDNPEKGNKIAQDIVKFISEYFELTNE